MVTVVPRNGETATTGGLAADGVEATEATAAGATGRARDSTSSRRILPPIPVPFTCARSVSYTHLTLPTKP
jgi:hypothetical protein